MSTKIIGATVGTPIKPSRIGKELKPVKTVNGVFPDKNGDVAVQAGSGIHVGAEPPTDENIQVWVDTDEEAEGGVTSWNDLKDKPFGEERTEQVIVGGELEPMEGDWYRFRLQDKAAVAGYLGMQLALTINDTRYDAIFNDDESASDYVCTIPDVARVDANQFGGAWIWTVYTMEAGTVSVAVVNETIKTIDPKYIPSGIGGGANIDVVATIGQMIVVKAVDENGKPTEWEAIDIPEGGAQADAVQADMAQSDSSKPDYIKNRTHWKETKLTNATEIIAETTFTGSHKTFNGVTLEAGKTYAVTYNGETYIRKAAAYSTAVYIGDVSIIIGTAHSTGEPFCLWYNGEYVVLNRRDNAAATISVTEGTAEEVYHQLDRRYIKDMYGDDFAEILPECQLTPMEDGGGFVVFDPLPTDLQPGETYTINWNGAAYECVALPYEEEGVQMGVMLGNAGALTGEGDSNEPFFMAVLSSEYAAAMGIGLIAYALDGSPAPTLSIMGAGGVVKIPEKYLPNCVVKTVNGVSPDETGNVDVPAVLYTEQTLTDEQKAQARANIGLGAYDWRPVYRSQTDHSASFYVSNIIRYVPQQAGTALTGDYPIKYDVALNLIDDSGYSYLCRLINAMDLLKDYTYELNYKNVIANVHNYFQALSNAGAFNHPAAVFIAFSETPEIEASVRHLCLLFRSNMNSYRLFNIKEGKKYIEVDLDGNVIFNNLNPLVDSSLSIVNRPADAKAVGDALATKVSTVNGIAPDEDGNVEVAGGGAGGGATWRVLDAIDLSSGAVLYEIDTTGCTEIMLVNKTALIGSSMSYAWKGFGMEGRSNNIVGKAVGSQIRLTYLGGGIISGISPRSDSDTLMKSVAFDDAIENNNTLCLSFGSVTSGIIVVGGK